VVGLAWAVSHFASNIIIYSCGRNGTILIVLFLPRELVAQSVGVPHFEFMIFTLPWPERCDCPGAVLSCDWSENQSRRGSL
jgi:hypothetical protein